MENELSQILMIKSFLHSALQLYQALAQAQSVLLAKVHDLCHPKITQPLLAHICGIIEEDVTFMKSPLDLRNQRTFAVKSGISGMLDVARQTYKELTDEIHLHVSNLIGLCHFHVKRVDDSALTSKVEEHRVNVSLKFDNGRKYWLRLRAADFENSSLPSIFVNVVRKKKNIECQTLDLVKLNVRLSDTSNEVVIRSDAVVRDLIHDLRQASPQLFRVCESVALLDMISSFAHVATTRGYVRPEIADTLAMKSARHPILDGVSVFWSIQGQSTKGDVDRLKIGAARRVCPQ